MSPHASRSRAQSSIPIVPGKQHSHAAHVQAYHARPLTLGVAQTLA
jgi:hypothetical protein